MTRAATVLLAAALAVLLALPLGADEGAARFFTERGAKALEGGDLDEAERNFTKALGEHAGWLPALHGLARVAHGRGDKPGAIGYLTEILDRRDRGGLSEEERAVADAAVELLKEIDRPRLEYREMVQAYVAKLVDLADRSLAKSPDLAIRCLERIAAVAPDHAAVARLSKELGVVPGARPAAGAPAGAAAAAEVPLFNGVDLDGWSGAGKVWQVEDGVLVSTPGNQAYYIRHVEPLEGDYTLVYEIRIREDTGNSAGVLFGFGYTGEYDHFSLVMFSDKFRLQHLHGGPDKKEIIRTVAFYEVKGGVDRSVFNRIEIRVKGRRATCLVNGREICFYDAPENVFAGFPALTVQDCTAEIRKIAVVR